MYDGQITYETVYLFHRTSPFQFVLRPFLDYQFYSTFFLTAYPDVCKAHFVFLTQYLKAHFALLLGAVYPDMFLNLTQLLPSVMYTI